MANDFCHIELNTDNVDRAQQFYSKLFSWKFEVADMGGHGTYTMITPGAGPNGGLMKKPMPDAPNMWLVYVQVDNLDTTLASVPKLGGKVVMPKTPIPNVGAFGIVQDPTGAVFGVWSK